MAAVIPFSSPGPRVPPPAPAPVPTREEADALIANLETALAAERRRSRDLEIDAADWRDACEHLVRDAEDWRSRLSGYAAAVVAGLALAHLLEFTAWMGLR